MAIVPGVTPVREIWPYQGARLDQVALRGPIRATYAPNATLPALGLVLSGAPRFTATSHNFTATMRPCDTADALDPAPIFTARPCTAYVGPAHQQTVVAVEWEAQDLAVSGDYRLQFRGTPVGGGPLEILPEIVINVTGAALTIQSYPQYGKVFWGGGSDMPSVHGRVIVELARNGMVVFSEPNATTNNSTRAVDYVAARPGGICGISVNDYSFWDPAASHYPMHQSGVITANAGDWWVRRQSGSRIAGWPGTYLFDKTNSDLRQWFVDQVAQRFLAAYPFSLLYLDERAAGLQQYNPSDDIVLYREQPTRAPSMTEAEVTAAWTNAQRITGQLFKARYPGLRIIGNGTYGADQWSNGVMRQGLPGASGFTAVFAEALAVASSVPIQNRTMLAHGIWSTEGGSPPEFLNATSQFTVPELQDLINWTAWLSPGYEAEFRRFNKFIACYGSMIDGFSLVDNNRFDWPWNHQEVAEGSFGRPLEYAQRVSTIPSILSQGTLRIRFFEFATVVMNLGITTQSYNGTPVAPLDALIIPVA